MQARLIAYKESMEIIVFLFFLVSFFLVSGGHPGRLKKTEHGVL